jgi:ribosomal protein S15P/S13E
MSSSLDPSALRKLAQALREHVKKEEIDHTKQAVLTLKAAQGLALLREKVRGL